MRLVPVVLLLAACGKPPLADTGIPKDTDPCPMASVDTEALDWGTVGPDERVEETITVTNDCAGAEDLVVDGYVTSGDPSFATADASTTVPPGGTGQITVRFRSGVEGSYHGTLELRPHDALDPIEVSLSARVGPGGGDTDTDTGDTDTDTDTTDTDTGSGCPDVPETRNGIDDDCDGLVDEDFVAEGDVLFDEVMINPKATDDTTGEWVELYNASAYDVDLIGWFFQGDAGPGMKIRGHTVVKAGGRVILAITDDPAKNGGLPSVDWLYNRGDFPFGDTDDRLRASLGEGGRLVTWVDWDATWPLLEGASLSLDPSHLTLADAVDAHNWCASSSAMSGGDFGTPGAANDVCTGDVDYDGDGFTVDDGDCDDRNVDVHPGAPELWGNFQDDDCDGVYDTATVDSVAGGYVDGSVRTDPDYLGFRSNMALGDVDGDKKPEVVLSSWYGWDDQGVVYVLDGDKYATYGGQAAAYAKATVHGDVARHDLGGIGSTMGDNTGDGVADLGVAGHDGYGGKAFALFVGKTISGDMTDADAAITLSGSQSSDRADAATAYDLDGDGIDDVVYAEGRAHDDTHDYDGRVAIFDASGLTNGDHKVEDADTVLRGAAAQDYFGETVGGGDLDGDGYDDLVIGAWGDDDGGNEAGAYYVVKGAKKMPASGTIDTAYDVKITGALPNRRVGAGAEPVCADLDGDAQMDLALGVWEDGQVWVFRGAGSLSGDVAITTGDLELGGPAAPADFGLGLAAGDFDGDGITDLAVGAPDDDGQIPAGTTIGEVWVFDVSTLFLAADTSSAHATITGMAAADGFGQTLLAGDVDGDGDVELIVDGPGASSSAGRVWFVDF